MKDVANKLYAHEMKQMAKQKKFEQKKKIKA